MYLFWLIPIVILAVVALFMFWRRVKTDEGGGHRTNGQTLVDKSGSGSRPT